jgi:hypothetical protein
MRKNFFKKKLASTLALAMVVTSLAVPTSASAATTTKIVKQGGAAAPTVLYVGTKGTDYGLSKVVKGNKYTWTTSNSAIATINKSGVVTAKAPGKVTIKVTARNSKGKWLSAYTKKVTVNQRATSIDAGADDFKLVIGQDKDLNAVKTPAKSTDTVKYVSDNTAVATVNAKSGVVKAVGVGEATITVLSKATSSTADASKYNKKDTVKVTVADGIQSVKQTTPVKLEVVFATDQSKKLTTSDLTITDADGVKQIIKSLSFSADGKTATAELYIDLADAKVYKVAYGTTEKTFTASKGAVASIAIEGKTVQYAKPTEFSVKLLDKNGVDVTTSEKLGYVTFEADNTEGFVGLNNNNKPEITIYNFPKSVTVSATYHTYDYKGGTDEVTYKASAVFNSVEEIKATAADITYTIAPTSDGADWTAIKTNIPASAYNYQVYLKAKDGSTDLTESDFKFESSDTTILSVSSDGRVYAIKAGSAYIKATYGATSKMLAVTVGAESKVISVTPNNNVSTFYYVPANGSNAARMVDTIKTIELTAKDQYNNTVSGNSITNVELLSSNLTSRGVNPFLNPNSSDSYMAYVNGNKLNLTWNGSTVINSDNDGTYTFRLTYEGKPVVVTVKVEAVSSSTVSYINFDAQSTTLDAVLTASASGNTQKVLNVYGYNNAGQQVIKYNSGITFTATLDGDSYNTSAATSAVTVSPASVTVKALEFATGGSVATQAAVGTYEIKASTTINGITKTATSRVIVKNTQVNPTIKLEKSDVSIGDVSSVLDVVNQAYSAKLNGNTLVISGAVVVAGNGPISTTALASGNTSYTIKKIIVDQPVTVNGNSVIVSRTITVNGIITVKN